MNSVQSNLNHLQLTASTSQVTVSDEGKTQETKLIPDCYTDQIKSQYPIYSRVIIALGLSDLKSLMKACVGDPECEQIKEYANEIYLNRLMIKSYAGSAGKSSMESFVSGDYDLSIDDDSQESQARLTMSDFDQMETYSYYEIGDWERYELVLSGKLKDGRFFYMSGYDWRAYSMEPTRGDITIRKSWVDLFKAIDEYKLNEFVQNISCGKNPDRFELREYLKKSETTDDLRQNILSFLR